MNTPLLPLARQAEDTNVFKSGHKILFFHSFHTQMKIHVSYSCMTQMTEAYSVDWGILSMPKYLQHTRIWLVYLPLRLEGMKKYCLTSWYCTHRCRALTITVIAPKSFYLTFSMAHELKAWNTRCCRKLLGLIYLTFWLPSRLPNCNISARS